MCCGNWQSPVISITALTGTASIVFPLFYITSRAKHIKLSVVSKIWSTSAKFVLTFMLISWLDTNMRTRSSTKLICLDSASYGRARTSCSLATSVWSMQVNVLFCSKFCVCDMSFLFEKPDFTSCTTFLNNLQSADCSCVRSVNTGYSFTGKHSLVR